MSYQTALIDFNNTEAALAVATNPAEDAYPVDFPALVDALRHAGANVTEMSSEALQNFTNMIFSQTCNYMGATSTATISQRAGATSLASSILDAAKGSVDTSCAGDIPLLRIVLPIVLVLALLAACASVSSRGYSHSAPPFTKGK